MESPKMNEIIKRKRRERELTQEELAAVLGVTKAAVSKWENEESYPDITMLPKIAQFFHITMDELFGYTLEHKPLKIVNEYKIGIKLSDLTDLSFFDHGEIKECTLQKYGYAVIDTVKYQWEVIVHMVSHEEDIPYTLQKYLKPGCLVDMYSYRLADGKIIDDDKPNKHYVCHEKVWEYNVKDNNTYIKQMLREQLEMGLISEDDL